MTSPSLIARSRSAENAQDLARRMARIMVERRSGPEEACTREHLRQEGFTDAQITALYDTARAEIAGEPSPIRWKPPGRLRGMLLVRDAQKIRERVGRKPWAAPVVGGEHS